MSGNYQATVLFRENYYSSAQVVVNQGGTSSGKTYAIQQVLFCLACASPNIVITVAGQDIPNLKAGALRDALAICNSSARFKNMLQTFNKSDRVFEFKNGSAKHPRPNHKPGQSVKIIQKSPGGDLEGAIPTGGDLEGAIHFFRSKSEIKHPNSEIIQKSPLPGEI